MSTTTTNNLECWLRDLKICEEACLCCTSPTLLKNTEDLFFIASATTTERNEDFDAILLVVEKKLDEIICRWTCNPHTYKWLAELYKIALDKLRNPDLPFKRRRIEAKAKQLRKRFHGIELALLFYCDEDPDFNLLEYQKHLSALKSSLQEDGDNDEAEEMKYMLSFADLLYSNAFFFHTLVSYGTVIRDELLAEALQLYKVCSGETHCRIPLICRILQGSSCAGVAAPN